MLMWGFLRPKLLLPSSHVAVRGAGRGHKVVRAVSGEVVVRDV
jgi:hypothetical protein